MIVVDFSVSTCIIFINFYSIESKAMLLDIWKFNLFCVLSELHPLSSRSHSSSGDPFSMRMLCHLYSYSYGN